MTHTVRSRVRPLPNQCYSPGFAFYGFEHSCGIHNFWPTWPFLIIKVLASWEKFLWSREHPPLNNFVCFRCSVRTRKAGFHKLVPREKKKNATCQHTNYHDTTDLKWNLHGLSSYGHVIYTSQTCTWQNFRGGSLGIVANLVDCGMIISKLKFQSLFNVHFWTNALWKGMNSSIHWTMVIPLIPSYKDCFGIT